MNAEQRVARPLLLGTYERRGGAAIAMQRLHSGLLARGVESRMLVQEGQDDDLSVHTLSKRPGGVASALRNRLDHLPLWRYPRRQPVLFSPAWRPEHVQQAVDALDPDLVHLHWVVDGFLRIETIAALRRPIVWTLHDMWPFTGGCHYAGSCCRYRESCGCCPQLGSLLDKDLSRHVWRRKMAALEGVRLVVVAPSRWLADCARSSSVLGRFPVRVIPNGIDLQVFHPEERRQARRELGLPTEGFLLLFGAADPTGDPRKGYDLLCAALARMPAEIAGSKIHLAVFGARAGRSELVSGPSIHWLGAIDDEARLRMVYAAADLFVAPSREENLSNTVLEALACGTPSVAFRVGGMPDMIEHGVNGYLASPEDPADLAAGMISILTSPQRHPDLSESARHKAVERFGLQQVAANYAALYQELLAEDGGGGRHG